MLKPIILQDTIGCLVPDMQRGDTVFVHEYLRNYPDLTTTQEFMELLCKRYEHLLEGAKEKHLPVKKTLCSIIQTVLFMYPEDFLVSPDLGTLKYLRGFLGLTMPTSELSLHVQRLLAQLEVPDPTPVPPELPSAEEPQFPLRQLTAIPAQLGEDPASKEKSGRDGFHHAD